MYIKWRLVDLSIQGFRNVSKGVLGLGALSPFHILVMNFSICYIEVIVSLDFHAIRLV
jgi:hypothetical protein